MDVKFTTSFVALIISGVFSLGFVPLWLWFHKKQMPAKLTEEEMILHNGRRLPWRQFTGMKVTQVHYNGSFLGTRYLLKHESGKTVFGTDKIANHEEVVRYILAHLPSHVVNAGLRAGVDPGRRDTAPGVSGAGLAKGMGTNLCFLCGKPLRAEEAPARVCQACRA